MRQLAAYFQRPEYEVTPFTSGRGAGQDRILCWSLRKKQGNVKNTVVFAHGAGNDAFYPQLSLFERLLRAGYGVITFDLPGHGEGGTSLFHEGALKNMLSDVFSSLPQGTGGIHLVGHSLGGWLVAAYLAENFADDILSASLISVPVQLAPGVRALAGELRSFFLMSAYRQLAWYGVTGILPAIGPFRRKTFPVRLADPGAGGYIKQVTELVNKEDLASQAARIRVPVLLCYGEKDALVTVSQGQILAANIGTSDFHTLKGETHFTSLLAEKCEFLVLNWINTWKTKSLSQV